MSQQESVSNFVVGRDAAPSSLGDFTRAKSSARGVCLCHGVVQGVGVLEDMRLLVTYDAKGGDLPD
jgi:hypothetical protein